MSNDYDVVIVGAGLAGLCCALRLKEAGRCCVLLEASDDVGGRVRTERVDGFLLDRGFQVFLTSYPEAARLLDYPALRLGSFYPGALVRCSGKFHRVSDPWRKPLDAITGLFSPVGTLLDKTRVARLRAKALRGTLDDLFGQPETTTLEALRTAGFSDSMIDRFFRPYLGGIFLDQALETSSRMMLFVFRMFARGTACLPAEGMHAIPRQLASRLPSEWFRFSARVTHASPGSVELESGERFTASTVVLATDEPATATLLTRQAPRDPRSVACIYFAAEPPPISGPLLVLNGDRNGPVSSLCVPSNVSPSYAPSGSSLVSVTVLDPPVGDSKLCHAVQRQCAEWFGSSVDDWMRLRVYRIPFALPNQAPPRLSPPERSVRCAPGLYVCGDHVDNASINGAMTSGRRAAEAIVEDAP